MLGLFSTAPAEAQTVWSATFTPAAFTNGIGCTTKTDCDSQLISNSFTVGGTNYHFKAFFRLPALAPGDLPFRFNLNQSINTALAGLKLCVGSNEYDLQTGASGINFNDQPGFSAGTPVSVSIGSSCTQQPTETLSVSANPACGSTVSDTSVQPRWQLKLTPAPAAETSMDYRPVDVNGNGLGVWRGHIAIRTSGFSIESPRENTFSEFRAAYPGFAGFQFRLRDEHSIEASCTWQFDDDGGGDTPPPTGDTPPPGGGDPGEGSRRGQIQEAVKRTLSALARRAMASTMDHIGARFGDLGTGGVSLAGRQASLRDHPALAALTGDDRGLHCAASGCLAPSGSRSMTVGELLGQGAFSVHLNAAPDGRGSAAAPRWSVWGRGDFGSFAGRGDPGQRYDGNLRTGWLGIDARSGSWVAGLAVSHGEGDADYTFSGDAVSGGGRLDTKLTAVYPYARWTLDNGLELHGVVGVGSGDADHRPQDGETESGDLTMRLAAAGFRHAFPERDGLSLAVRADASVTRIKTDHGPDDIHGLSADSWRLRAGLEASRRVALERGAELQPFLEAAVRHDGGDGLDGNGMELAGGLRYAAPDVYLEARGRWLATHSDKGAQEKGVSVTARAGPGTNGRGLFFALSPRWGAHAGGAQTLWGEAMATPSASADKASVDAQLGYAFAAPVPGVLTPFVETRLGGDAQRHLRLGTRFEAAHANLRMELVGERSENEAARPEHALRFTLRLSFF